MSTPIPLPLFKTALTDLPLDSLYAKYHELGNQMRHLERSNKELEGFVGDKECEEARVENGVVLGRFREMRGGIRWEVCGVRGVRWGGGDGEDVGVEEEGEGVEGRRDGGERGRDGEGVEERRNGGGGGRTGMNREGERERERRNGGGSGGTGMNGNTGDDGDDGEGVHL
ncbi:hypothetical protein BDW02DRAFT_556702 [Decorospora gaudefroyi]|uniref:Uncharacterized protein n=1 Tax=Decorospora gaudefroyi TaxID=184978 RepID=A0A6A5KAM3_9PLEO|nr:hypothetical protein BDW02DRAFT_556702 [Decorospora gaudefroyi]